MANTKNGKSTEHNTSSSLVITIWRIKNRTQPILLMIHCINWMNNVWMHCLSHQIGNQLKLLQFQWQINSSYYFKRVCSLLNEEISPNWTEFLLDVFRSKYYFIINACFAREPNSHSLSLLFEHGIPFDRILLNMQNTCQTMRFVRLFVLSFSFHSFIRSLP